MLNVLRSIPARVWLILTRPERFFKKIVVDGSFEESIVKAFLYGLIGGLAVLVLDMAGGWEIGIGGLSTKIIAYPVVAVGVLFACAGLMMFFSEITGGSRDWELAVKGVSSIFFLYPVILVVDALAWNCMSLWFVSVVVDAYVLFLLYNIAHFCMGGKRAAVLGVVIGCAVLFLVLVYGLGAGMWLWLKNPTASAMC